MVFNRFRASTSLPDAGEGVFAAAGDGNADFGGNSLRCVVDREKKEVAAIKVRRNYHALQRSIPEFAYASPERMAEIAGILATAPL